MESGGAQHRQGGGPSDLDQRLDRILRHAGLRLAPTADALLRATWAPGSRSTVPTWQVADVAADAGAPDADGLGLCMAASYAAAHLLDDLADADATGVAWARGSLDVVRLLAVSRACLDAIHDLSPQTRQALGRELDRLQIELCDGQLADLSDRERLVGDPWSLAEAKAGAGLAGYFAMAARCVPGTVDRDRWWRAGHAFGTLGQVCSDVFDLMAGPESEDWLMGLPSTVLRLAMDCPVGPQLRLALAGPRPLTWAPARRALAMDDPLWSALGDGLQTRLKTLEHEVAGDARLQSLSERARGLVDRALASRGQVRPLATTRLPRWGQLRTAALAFLGADPGLAEAVVTHRWGLGDRSCVQADVFQRLVVLDMLRAASDDEKSLVHGNAPALLERARVWGWRYFGDFPQLSPDIDTTGMALRVMADQPARFPESTEADLVEAAAVLLDDPQPAGLLHTWRPHARCVGRWKWDPRPCPVATTNALVGLHTAYDNGIPDAWSPRAARALAAVMDWARQGGATSLYPRGVAEGWVLLGLVRMGTRADTTGAQRALVDRIQSRWTRQGRLGGVLDTAFGVAGLRAARAIDMAQLQEATAALAGAQDPDGGFPADPFFPSISPGLAGQPGPAPRLVGSRLLTTAVVVFALMHCDGLPLGQRAAIRS